MALLRMIPLSTGQITIDNTDITSLDGNALRSSLNVVPQDAYFMPGTVRFNIDPRGTAADVEIERAIRKVGLWERVAAAGGLDAELQREAWSQGERQLLCLARAVVVGSSVLVLDEATSRFVFSSSFFASSSS